MNRKSFLKDMNGDLSVSINNCFALEILISFTKWVKVFFEIMAKSTFTHI